MLLLELAAQGIRGVAPPGGRVILRPGYNVFVTDGLVLYRVLEAMFWPDRVSVEAIPRSSGGPGAISGRVGVTLLGHDHVTYRLVRDLTAGCQLHRFDAERRSFTLLSQDLPGIGRHLVSPCGMPSRSRFEVLLSICTVELPSKQAAGGLRNVTTGVTTARQPLSVEERDRKIAQLKVELEKTKSTEKRQYLLDELQSRLFKLEEVLQAGSKIREGLKAAEATLRDLAPVTAVVEQLGDPEARLAAFEKAKGKLDEGMEKLDAERAALGEESTLAPIPFWTDMRFVSAAGAGLAFMVLAFIAGVVSETGFRYLALLGLPAFTYAGYFAWRWVDEFEARERSERRRKRFQEWEQKLQEQYERETAHVRGAMARLGYSSLTDLKDALGRLADAQSAIADWRQRLSEWDARPETRNAAEEKERVDTEIREAEVALASETEGYLRDPGSIETEIASLEAEPSMSVPVVTPTVPVTPAVAGRDTLKMLVESAAAELQSTPAAVLRVVSRRVSEILSAFSAQRFTSLLTDERGNLLIQGGGRTIPVATLPPIDRDLCFLALKMGLFEHALSSGKGVAFVDEAFTSLPEGARRVAARFLKQLARAGQILHTTSDPVFREAADHAG